MMVTREHRLAEFSTEAPALDTTFELLCEDHAGTYVLPHPCIWFGGEWRNADTKGAIEAKVLGWRVY